MNSDYCIYCHCILLNASYTKESTACVEGFLIEKLKVTSLPWDVNAQRCRPCCHAWYKAFGSLVALWTKS